MKKKIIKTALFLTALFCLPGQGVVCALEEKEEDFMRIEFEEEQIPENEFQILQRRLSELEFYYSELKAQETAALKGIPAAMKKKQFRTLSEKAGYYLELSDKYSQKLANEELGKSDIKISQNLIILSELYKAQASLEALKEEIRKIK